MGNSSYSNFKAFEGTLSSDTTLTFSAWRPRSITITNDSGSIDLLFKFNASESYGTLKPGETVNPDIIARTVYLSGTGAEYRVWGIG